MVGRHVAKGVGEGGDPRLGVEAQGAVQETVGTGPANTAVGVVVREAVRVTVAIRPPDDAVPVVVVQNQGNSRRVDDLR